VLVRLAAERGERRISGAWVEQRVVNGSGNVLDG
jgi:hypothetical protein